MKKNKIKIILFSLLLPAWLGASLNYASALNLRDAFSQEENSPLEAAAGQGSGFNTKVTFEKIAGAIITSAVSLMGVIFLGLALYAGYGWMTARGNEEAVEKAKNTLTNAIIGLVVVLAAYAISYFIVSRISPVVLRETSSAEEEW